MAIHFDIIRDGRKFSVRVDGNKTLPVAQRARYQTHFGLSNDGGFFGNEQAQEHLYLAADYADAYPYWSEFIEPTAICEGQSFLSLNTYDRARFTFGFGQFAAHVPDGDFIRWFRDMLQRPEVTDYFPNFEVRNGRIVKIEGIHVVPMETATSTEPLQLYFNPGRDEVEDAEVIAAAKFIHWTLNHEGARLLQVQHMINTAKRLIKESDNRLGLDGRTGDICCVVMDVRHQGRAGFDDLQAALLASDPYAALLEVGGEGEPERIVNLKAAMATRRTKLKRKKWSRALAEFV